MLCQVDIVGEGVRRCRITSTAVGVDGQRDSVDEVVVVGMNGGVVGAGAAIAKIPLE